jgi:hypothetical protein
MKYHHVATSLLFSLAICLQAETPTATEKKIPTPDLCLDLGEQLKERITAEPERVLEFTSDAIKSNPACSCELTKAAILASNADRKTVAAIVEAAILAHAESYRIIAHCALAQAPDATSEIQALFNRMKLGNPLDFPGIGNVGPTPGGQGGNPLLPPLNPMSLPPKVIAPPPVTVVNP